MKLKTIVLCGILVSFSYAQCNCNKKPEPPKQKKKSEIIILDSPQKAEWRKQNEHFADEAENDYYRDEVLRQTNGAGFQGSMAGQSCSVGGNKTQLSANVSDGTEAVFFGDTKDGCQYAAIVKADEKGYLLSAKNFKQCVGKPVEEIGDSAEMVMPESIKSDKERNLLKCKEKGFAETDSKGYDIQCHYAQFEKGSFYNTVISKDHKLVDRIIER